MKAIVIQEQAINKDLAANQPATVRGGSNVGNTSIAVRRVIVTPAKALAPVTHAQENSTIDPTSHKSHGGYQLPSALSLFFSNFNSGRLLKFFQSRKIMKSRKRLVAYAIYAAGAIFSLACADASAEAHLPLKGTINFQAAMSQEADPSCPLVGMNHGAGHMAQLGMAIMAATECIVPDSPSMTTLNAYNGKLTLTAANGDTVTASYAGTFVLSADGKTYVTNGFTFAITGGTGRFARATGRGDLTGTQDAVNGIGKLSVMGTISY